MSTMKRRRRGRKISEKFNFQVIFCGKLYYYVKESLSMY